MENEAQALFYKPTLAMRLFRALGFRYPDRDRMEDFEDDKRFAQSYLFQEIVLCLDWKDRLRVLLTGQVMVAISTKTDKPVECAVGRSKVGILPWKIIMNPIDSDPRFLRGQ